MLERDRNERNISLKEGKKLQWRESVLYGKRRNEENDGIHIYIEQWGRKYGWNRKDFFLNEREREEEIRKMEYIFHMMCTSFHSRKLQG